jgi:hypothetical protein
MTAAAIGREGARFGEHPLESTLNLPVAAATRLYQGTLVMALLIGATAGYLTPAAATTSPAKVVGVAQYDVDNSAGAAAAKYADIDVGLFTFVNSATTDAIDATMVGQPCYAADDSTVARTPGAANTRPFAGRIMGMDGSLVIVAVGGYQADPFGCVDLPFLAGADYSVAGQNLFVKAGILNTVLTQDAVGGDCVGVLINNPASGAIAIVRVAGKAPVIASGTVAVWSRVATTAAGKTKVAQVTRCDASGASATAALTGSYTMGLALTAGVTDTIHQVLLQPMGAIPGTAA